MTQDNKENIMQWLEKAEHDIIAAKTLIDVQPLILDVACFHCQQAAEKLLKAFILSRGQEIQKTHDLILLREKCAVYDSAFSLLDFKNLNEFAVDARYPDFISPSLDEAKEYLTIAEKVKQLVCGKIKFD